ncbi:hypothetical protein LCGC14_2073360 [marine sediment metagenome]|uniref:Uncharacterized protein n=1 Tax=marine sediment metagenome TaxID=412755 RepID=A0A0F9EHY7_9ZZZZ
MSRKYFIELECKVEIKSNEMPDESIEMDIRKRIRTKVFCNRENLELIEIGSKIYEVEIECEED